MTSRSATAIAIAAFIGLTYATVSLAEVPGGKTIGGGVEKKTKLSRDDSAVLFSAHKLAGIPACITVVPRNDGNLELTIFNEPAGGAADTLTILIPTKEQGRTDCVQGLVRALITCTGGDCEFDWRVDQLAPIAEPDPGGPNETNDPQEPF